MAWRMSSREQAITVSWEASEPAQYRRMKAEMGRRCHRQGEGMLDVVAK
jgi:hypothetical protein